MCLRRGFFVFSILLCSSTPQSRGELISVVDALMQPVPISGSPGDTVSAFILLHGNTTPLLGYSLDLDVAPVGVVVGSAVANVGLTNFFDARNLITAGGAIRDPFFSSIIDPADGGVFLSTITQDLSTVLAVDGVNDVLAQIFFDISLNAQVGDTFEISFGAATALSDASAFPVAFTLVSGTIVVIPEPVSCFTLLAACGYLSKSRRRRFAIWRRSSQSGSATI